MKAATKVSEEDQKALKEGGEFFLNMLGEMIIRPEIQRAADNLASLLSWAEGAQNWDKCLKKNFHPLQVIAMGILIGKRGGKFPFTSAGEVRAFARVLAERPVRFAKKAAKAA
jgi:hypothetical protein